MQFQNISPLETYSLSFKILNESFAFETKFESEVINKFSSFVSNPSDQFVLPAIKTFLSTIENFALFVCCVFVFVFVFKVF